METPRTGPVRGTLEHAGAPPAGAVLEPFGAPDACVVRLALPDTTGEPV